MGISDEETDQNTRQRRRERSSTERGQTTLDFAIGISIFLAVLIFIFLFIPGVLSPFTESTQEETVASNRIADQLAKGMLASPSEPYVLDRYCTVEFFDGTNANPSGCNYDDATPDIERIVGLDTNRDNLNVTIRGNVSTAGDGTDILCWKDDVGLAEKPGSCTSGDVYLTRGDSPPSSSQASVTSVRVVSLNREDVTLYVEMW